MQPLEAYTLEPQTLARAINYASARHALYFASVPYSGLVLWSMLRLRIGPRLSRLHSAGFFAVMLLIVGVALVPIDTAAHAISRHFQISIQPWPSWLGDWIKQLLSTVVIGTLLAWPFYALVRRNPRRWWFQAWLASLPLLVIGAVIEPLVFDPLFNHFVPLSRSYPNLVIEIESLLKRARVQIPADRLLEMSASEKTNSLNAYVTGFGPSRRLVLYDTIIRKEDREPLLTTVGHELGHYVLNHIPKGLAFAGAMLLLGFWLAYLVAREWVSRWGEKLGIDRVGSRSSFPLLLLIIVLLNFFADPIANAYSRNQEHEADLYSLEVTHGIVPNAPQAAARAFQIEGETDLDVPNPSRFIVFWLYSHPPTADRLRFALSYNPWAAGLQPKFVRDGPVLPAP